MTDKNTMGLDVIIMDADKKDKDMVGGDMIL